LPKPEQGLHLARIEAAAESATEKPLLAGQRSCVHHPGHQGFGGTRSGGCQLQKEDGSRLEAPFDDEADPSGGEIANFRRPAKFMASTRSHRLARRPQVTGVAFPRAAFELLEDLRYPDLIRVPLVVHHLSPSRRERKDTHRFPFGREYLRVAVKHDSAGVDGDAQAESPLIGQRKLASMNRGMGETTYEENTDFSAGIEEKSHGLRS
jgi:hypothetical protein